ncbi:protein MEMO1-like [Lycorma delicatula]|uniref:protein MEMO1-like n=1 Tax=Lycorma delicatula TaxID=130591 RepID=UPI003F5119F0
MRNIYNLILLFFITVVIFTETLRTRKTRIPRINVRRYTRKRVTRATKPVIKREKERPLSFSGISYEYDKKKLTKQIDEWVNSKPIVYSPARAIIVPHADLRLCGNITGNAFRQIDKTIIKRVFLIGPSHYFQFQEGRLTPSLYYQTPFNSIEIDTEVYSKLIKTGHFMYMDEAQDELEHSLENVLPFLGRVMGRRHFKLVPIIFGDLDELQMKDISKFFLEYLNYEENLFIISSDFCHWGKIYNFTIISKVFNTVNGTIYKLDEYAMKTISTLDPNKFQQYLNRFKNNICGQVPISLFLHTVKYALDKYFVVSFKFLDYTVCNTTNTSFVGCAAAALVVF